MKTKGLSMHVGASCASARGEGLCSPGDRYFRYVLGFLTWLVLIQPVTWGQQKNSVPFSPMGTPVLGYLFDSSAGGIRPIVGVPGAARIREPLDLGVTLTYAAISPQQSYAVAVTTEKQMVVIDLGRSGFGIRPMDGANPEVDRIVFGSSGSSVALYNPQSQHIQTWSRLPDAPVQTADFDVSQISGALTALAVRDDSAVLAGFSQDETGSLFLLVPERDPVRLYTVGHPSAVLFLNRGRDALVSDYTSNNIFYVADVLGSAGFFSIASEQNGIVRPIDMALSGDDNRIIVANESAGITALSLQDGTIQSIAADGVAALHRLNGKAVFLMGSPSGTSLRIFDGDSTEPRMLVLPSIVPPEPKDIKVIGPGGKIKNL
jgi:hypothetical protein